MALILDGDLEGMRMPETMLAALSNIRTVEEMIVAFRDEEHCRRLLETMVWAEGRICPACGYKRSIALAGRDTGKRRARPAGVNKLKRVIQGLPDRGRHEHQPGRKLLLAGAARLPDQSLRAVEDR